MIFTLYYMYATLLQWWRLGSLKNKLNGTFNAQNAIMVCNESVICETKKVKSFENLLFRFDDRIGCTIVPRQKVNLCQWISFPRDYRYFPIYFNNKPPKVFSPNIYVLVQAILDTYNRHSADLIELEHFGELIAWRASDSFEAIVKTDLDKLTKLIHCFSQSNIDINHELLLLKIETVDVEGFPTKIKFDKKYSLDSTLKYSHAPIYWTKFAENLKELYSRMRDTTNPKITIENGRPDDSKKVPVSEVKPIKKDSRKHEDKNTLEVGSGDYRRHKAGEHKREKSTEKHKTDHTYSKKEEYKHKTSRTEKESKYKDDKERTREFQKKEEETRTKSKKSDREEKEVTKSTNSTVTETPPQESRTGEIDCAKAFEEKNKSKKVDRHSKPKSVPSKTDLEKPGKSSDRSKIEYKNISRRSSSSEKKLVKSMAVWDDTDHNSKTYRNDNNFTSNHNGVGDGNKPNNEIKPLNILVFADSQIAKENVKAALLSMVNKEKYTIYDLPTDPNMTMWKNSTILLVVCGTVPPGLTSHLLQFLLNGGQLLCLCSDFLYSVLHTFTTAEVREHELVRFTYGKWEQVKMMHHIFCYQASPAKKQFSKDSDHSNHSSGNGSSPIAPRTPSIVEIQHNAQDYIIQVQVLGTEETWHTPSLLLATVKGGKGKAVFSQVHLEINPNQYEDDENKFAALKESDPARLEILKDILLNHLDIDCSTSIDCSYTPAFFLGRHETKMRLLTESECIKDNILETGRLTIKFCSKDENTICPSAKFLPVLIHSCPTNFSTLNYFENLETEHIGRLVIYSDIITCTQYIENKKLEHGLVVIARQQTKGQGRSDNVWLSPLGCAPFSLQVHVPLDSPLGKSLPLLQHLGTLAIVSAIRRNNSTKDLDIGLKWPNDIYLNGTVKIGGDNIGSFIIDNLAVATIGCGVNLNNTNPTVCINDAIRETNETKGTNMKTISFELYLALVFNEFERIFNIVQAGDIDYFYELYYTYWLHNQNNDVTVTDKNGVSEQGRIVGIDDFGFLKIRRQNGSIMTVHPDGNRFDMLAGLIYPKTF